MAKTWNNIPEKKVLATFKEKSTLKGTVSEKFDIYVDGAVPGGDGDVQGISMIIDPSTYVMTTQLKDGKGGNVGSPATIDLPLESMVVGGEYDDNTKSVILTLKNGQTVTFSVADLVSGLQTEITAQNPLDADLIDDSSSDKKLVTSMDLDRLEQLPEISAEPYRINFQDANGNEISIDINNISTGGVTNPISYTVTFNGEPLSDSMMYHALREADCNYNSDTIILETLDPGLYLLDDYSTDMGVTIYADSERTNEVTGRKGVWLVEPDASYSHMYYFPQEDPYSAGGMVIFTLIEGEAVSDVEVATKADINNLQPVINQSNKLSADYIAETNNNKVMTSAERTKLAGIATGAEVNVQSDWNQTNSSADDYIKNKPTSLGGKKFYYDAESSGSILYVENVAIYKDPELTESATGEDVFQALNEGTVNLIGMMVWETPHLPWSSETIVSSADDAMDGTGRSLFFHIFGLGIKGTIGWSSDSQTWSRWNVESIGNATTNDLDARVKQGQGAPTTSTRGSKGQLYEDTTNGKVYVCTNRSGNTTTWKELVKAGDNVSGLNNDSGYQNASQVSSAIASAVGQITSLEYEVVQTLPASGEAGTIYLVANSGTTPNIYDEYIWVNNVFEKIGTTEIDLSNYYTKTQTDTLLGAKADQSTTYTKTEVDTALGNKANSSDVYTKTQVDTALAGKQDTIDANHKLDADLIDNSTSDNKTYETGTGAPTTSTTGSVGELYVDKSTGTVYVCISNTGGTYTWEEIGGGSGPTVVQTTGQSTTSVMSQKAVTDAIDAVDGISITMTYTDPGEGSSLQANHFIAVYEV